MPDPQGAVVALDVDGVLLDFEAFFQKILAAVVQRPVYIAQANYDLRTRYDVTPDEAEKAIERLARQRWSQIPAEPGAQAGYQRLVSDGYRPVAITGIDPARHDERMENLEALGMPVERLICTGGPGVSKAQALRQVAPAWFVDDRLVHLAEAEQAGLQSAGWVYRRDYQEPLARVDQLFQGRLFRGLTLDALTLAFQKRGSIKAATGSGDVAS